MATKKEEIKVDNLTTEDAINERNELEEKVLTLRNEFFWRQEKNEFSKWEHEELLASNNTLIKLNIKLEEESKAKITNTQEVCDKILADAKSEIATERTKLEKKIEKDKELSDLKMGEFDALDVMFTEREKAIEDKEKELEKREIELGHNLVKNDEILAKTLELKLSTENDKYVIDTITQKNNNLLEDIKEQNKINKIETWIHKKVLEEIKITEQSNITTLEAIEKANEEMVWNTKEYEEKRNWYIEIQNNVNKEMDKLELAKKEHDEKQNFLEQKQLSVDGLAVSLQQRENLIDLKEKEVRAKEIALASKK